MSKLKLFASFAFGVVIGVAVMAALMIHGPNQVIQNMWIGAISENALYAKLLNDGKSAEVQKRLESTFVSGVAGMQALGFPKEAQQPALWDIRLYYEKTGKAVPAELQATFAALPPKPPSSCRLRLEADSKP